ncbi:MAG: GAF domain-containing sensor histidine kinase [Caldilinea sp.]|nr:GAF domain-containing sensor histidine kinase [Caldilinea sp.]MDW8440252.1 GAF domain-containing sensor histidine kinase [Caldilineaceae bacterium]
MRIDPTRPTNRSDQRNQSEQGTQVIQVLLLFRWASLAPALIVWLISPAAAPLTGWMLLALATITAIISLRHRTLNRWLQQKPWLLSIDLALSAAAIALTDGVISAFYFHALSPILAAAFFFKIRGGLTTALAFTPLYISAVLLARQQPTTVVPTSIELYLGLTQLFTVYLIAVIFGYSARLLETLRQQTERLSRTSQELIQSNAELEHMNQQLRLIQSLTLSLQSAVEPVEMQQVLLKGLVEEMGYHTAAVALNDGDGALVGWMLRRRNDAEAYSAAQEMTLDLQKAEESPVGRAVRTQRFSSAGVQTPPTGEAALDGWLHFERAYVAAPLHLRGNLIGVLLVETEELAAPSDAKLTPLALVANHASVALGSLRLCIERTQRLASEEVRNRIAADIHDSVSQQLFGLAYGLNACNQLLEQHPEATAQVKAQLANLEPLAFAALHQMRSAVLGLAPGGLDGRRLIAGLRKHMASLCVGRTVAFDVYVTPTFDRWPLALRHELLLIAQEGVANIARHANACHARLEIAEHNGAVVVYIEDDGVGFDPAQATIVDGVGLDGIRRRVERLGGRFSHEACPGAGVRLHIDIPLPRPAMAR